MDRSELQLKGFGEAVQSLKLYRRAELRDSSNDEPLIEALYVDPLQNDAVLETMLRPSTTFLVGRKGTGKSTVFQRAQHEIRKRKNAVSAYVDIKTVYESSAVDEEMIQKLASLSSTLARAEISRLLLYRAFTRAVFQDVQRELSSQINDGFLARLFGGSKNDKTREVVEAVRTLLDGAFEADLTDITAFADTSVSTSAEAKASSKTSENLGINGGLDTAGAGSLGLAYSANREHGHELAAGETQQYSRILLKTFNINRILERLDSLLAQVNIKSLYIFIDDFSELPPDAMTVFVDAVLAPLNNWSNELIKFKIAAYPGRIYLGKIDSTKIDEIYLDTYRLYGLNDVSSMEDKAIDFTRRLLESRFHHFLGRSFDEFCDSDPADVYRQLFFASMGNPRILGHLLHNLRESHVAYGRGIGPRAILDAAARYYEEKVEPFFGIQKFALETFEERSSIFSLKELLETLAARARELREYKSSEVTRDIRGRTPSSHFHVVSELESLLSTLELNFFLTKYFEMKDRDGRKVSVFALNYGLCARHGISFGRPAMRREHRLYFVERIFDYSSIITKYIQKNQEIRCDTCGDEHGLDKLESLKLFGMLCPSCKEGKCVVINLSRKYEAVLKEIGSELLLPPTELGILETLYTEGDGLAAKDIAGELDCSYQLVGKRGKIMEERGLVGRDKNQRGRRIFAITEKAKDEYFDHNEERRLRIPEG